MTTHPDYRAALRAAFGPSADKIPGVDPTCGTGVPVPVEPLRVLLSDEGRTFAYCGDGEVFGVMRSTADATRLVFYLVRKDRDGQTWERERDRISAAHRAGETVSADDWRVFHQGRPSARYEVVASL